MSFRGVAGALYTAGCELRFDMFEIGTECEVATICINY